jgi:hypothetical protein
VDDRGSSGVTAVLGREGDDVDIDKRSVLLREADGMCGTEEEEEVEGGRGRRIGDQK